MKPKTLSQIQCQKLVVKYSITIIKWIKCGWVTRSINILNKSIQNINVDITKFTSKDFCQFASTAIELSWMHFRTNTILFEEIDLEKI